MTFLEQNSWFNESSIGGQVPCRPWTTFSAHMKYSSTRSWVQPTGLWEVKSLRLYSLSASLTSFASCVRCGACTIWSLFFSSLGRLLSSVTCLTMSVTCLPNLFSNSSKVVSVPAVHSNLIFHLQLPRSSQLLLKQTVNITALSYQPSSKPNKKARSEITICKERANTYGVVDVRSSITILPSLVTMLDRGEIDTINQIN